MIWVLTAGFGEGHNSAAKHAAQGLACRFPNERVEVTDLLLAARPRLTSLMQAGYRQIVVQQPWLWRIIYDRFARQTMDHTARWLRPVVDQMRRTILNDKPRAIVSTFPLYSALFAILRREGVVLPPLITIVTDSIAIHPAWIVAPSDMYCVIDAQTEQIVHGMGVPSNQLRVTGFPVSLQLCAAAALPPEPRAGVLYMPSTSEHDVAQTLAALRPGLQRGTPLTVVPGRNAKRYYHVLRRFADACEGSPLAILSWTDDMPRLLRTHQLIITKSGGAITNEALATRLPVVIDNVIPGQEEGNAHLLTSNGCGLRAYSPKETGACVERMLANDGALARTMSERMAPLSQPCAAKNVAEVVSGIIGEP